MWQYALRVGVSALVIVAVAAVAKRSTGWAALLASLPLTSLLAFVWLHVDGGDGARIAALSQGIFWLVLPSLLLFLILPALLRHGWSFWPSLAVACAATMLGYAVMLRVLARVGINL